MSELSKKEQAQLNTGAEEQAERLKTLNAEYEERFPGLRFVYVINSTGQLDNIDKLANPSSRTFVNGRSRDVIMEEMRQRIGRGDKDREVEETIQVCLRYYRRKSCLLTVPGDVRHCEGSRKEAAAVTDMNRTVY